MVLKFQFFFTPLVMNYDLPKTYHKELINSGSIFKDQTYIFLSHKYCHLGNIKSALSFLSQSGTKYSIVLNGRKQMNHFIFPIYLVSSLKDNLCHLPMKWLGAFQKGNWDDCFFIFLLHCCLSFVPLGKCHTSYK